MASCGPHFRNGSGSLGPMVAVGYRNPGFSFLGLPLSNHLKLSHLGVITELYGPLCPLPLLVEASLRQLTLASQVLGRCLLIFLEEHIGAHSAAQHGSQCPPPEQEPANRILLMWVLGGQFTWPAGNL